MVARALRRHRRRARPRAAGAATATTGSARSPTARSTGSSPRATAPRFDPSKVLLDPRATEVVVPARPRPRAWRRRARRRQRRARPARRRPPAAAAAAAAAVDPRGPVVYEAHVRGLTRRRRTATTPARSPALVASCRAWPRSASPSSSCCRCTRTIRRRAATGATCRWPSAPSTASTRPATTPPASWPTFVAAAHDARHRGVARRRLQPHDRGRRDRADVQPARARRRRRTTGSDDDGSYIETTGCGNDLDAASPVGPGPRAWSLDRLADLGVDGFRFDLAAGARPATEPFIARLDAWAAERGVGMIAEPWDAVGTHQLGRAWPGAGLAAVERPLPRGRPRRSCAASRARRRRWRSGSRAAPTSFDAPLRERQLPDLPRRVHAVRPRRLRPQAQRGQRPRQPRRRRRQPLVELRLGGRRRRARRGARRCAAASCATRGACWRCRTACRWSAMGDEFGRTQGGNNNAYNQDNETSWVDWARRGRVRRPRAVRAASCSPCAHRHPVLPQPDWWGDAVRFFGAAGAADLGRHSRSLAWSVGDLYVIANAWWEPLRVRRSRPPDRGAASSTRRCRRPTTSSPPAAGQTAGLRRRPALRRHPRTRAPDDPHSECLVPSRVRGCGPGPHSPYGLAMDVSGGR